jgi:integrase
VADLTFDCLRFVGHGWAIHVPLGKLKTERLVPVDSFVCRVVDHFRLLRSQDPLPADGFLLARPSGRYQLIRKLRNFWRDIVVTVGITTRIVPHQLRHYAASRIMPRVRARGPICGRLSCYDAA